MAYGKNFSARVSSNTVTPQTQAIPGREDAMVVNRAGGVVFKVDAWDRLRRFLILGSDGATYYAGAREMTLDNVEGVLECLRLDGLRTVREIVAVSKGGLAPKNDPALYALALASAYGVAARDLKIAKGLPVKNERKLAIALTNSTDPMAAQVRRAAFDALPDVARTGTHIMQFVGYMESVRGWGRGPREAIARWLAHYDDERLALQAVKYRQRGDWTLRDILRLASPKIKGENRRALIDWIVHRDISADQIAAHDARVAQDASKNTRRRHTVRPSETVIADARARFRLINGYHALMETQGENAAANMVRENRLPFELVPSEFLSNRNVWDALLSDMPLTNMLRNLNKMTAVGLLEGNNAAVRYVAEKLLNKEALQRARVHPFQILLASKTYAQGKGFKGSLTWTPVAAIKEVLDAAFYEAFHAVVPTGKRYVLGNDISGSMDSSSVLAGGVPSPVTAREAAGAMSMVTLATEPECRVVGFTAGGNGCWIPEGNIRRGGFSGYGYGSSGFGVTPIPLNTRMRMDQVCKVMEKLPMGRTDCALPILWALNHGILADAFVIYTDNETYAGNIHVNEALRMYREKTGIPAKLIACAFTATSYSVADTSDPGQMNVVGFDASAPSVIADFVRGNPLPIVENKAQPVQEDEGYTPSFG